MIHQLIRFAGKHLAKNKLSILQYHQILPQRDPLMRRLTTAEEFDWQMRLVKHYFTPLSLSEALTLMEKNALPDNAMCVTFDDGYLNNLTVAQPILEKYNIPAIVYVATGFSHGRNMWNERVYHLFRDLQRTHLTIKGETISLGDWDDRRIKLRSLINQLKYLPLDQRDEAIDKIYAENEISSPPPLMMTPEQIKSLSERGIEIGAHTVNHPILAVMSPEQQKAEIAQSKQQLEAWINKPVEHFAYPNGIPNQDYDQTTIGMIRDCQLKSAVITEKGVSDSATDKYQLHRFTPWDQQPLKFHLRLLQNQIAK